MPHPDNIIDVPVNDELRTSFLSYAMSVIVSRALPDARDGLKPVHRRILYAMDQLNLRPDRAYVKSARVVGETMGKYHPHGDAAIYDALVRLAQDWAMRINLVDGHGNFGTHSDAPAAARYTEARMAKAAIPMTEELGEDTVDFVPNYDGSAMEPSVLPAAFPNLIVNGSEGIAVGMATKMAPHNLREAVAACQYFLNHPDASVEDLMQFIPAPDLPTGGFILNLGGVREAYETGRGSFTIRARTHFEDVSARRKGIVVTELPYQVGPERVIEAIKKQREQGRLAGVSNVVDLTDRKSGLRLVVECKTGHAPQTVLDELLRYTPLQTNFHIHNLALVDGQPRTLTLRDLVESYVQHRVSVTTRRCEFRRRKARERAHLLEGYVKALAKINEVVAVIRKSKDTAEARSSLMSKFVLTEVQATAILEMPLRRLTSLEVEKIEAELTELRNQIEELTHLLTDEVAMNKLISDELGAVAQEYGTVRAAQISTDSPEIELPAVPGQDEPEQECVVTLSSTGLIGYAVQDIKGRTKNDALRAAVTTTTHASVAAVTSKGRALFIRVGELPVITGKERGGLVTDYVALEPGEGVVGVIPLENVEHPIAFGTKNGVVKLLNPKELPKRTDNPVMGVKDDDEILSVVPLQCPVEETDLVFITSGGQLLRTPATNVRPQGRTGGGVAGVRLPEDVVVIAFSVVTEGDVEEAVVVTVTDGEKQTLKVTPFAEFPAKGRAGGGVRCHRLLAGQSQLVAGNVGTSLVTVTDTGTLVALPGAMGRRDGSGEETQRRIAGVQVPR